MIYVCADDYGLFDKANDRIIQCAENGVLNKISVLMNFENSLESVFERNDINLSLHLNLVEGKMISDKSEVKLITDENGFFKYSFIGLMILSFTKPKEFKQAVYEEIKAQVKLYKKLFKKNEDILIDSHQHTHMIPGVFKMLLKVISEENIKVKYLRIPAEPILPYLSEPSLYFTYSPVNIIKQWLLKAFWTLNKKEFKKLKIPTAYFLGILFSGKMDEKRVVKILPHYIKKAKKNGEDIEILFHPGYIKKEESELFKCNESFKKFYYSNERQVEFNTLMSEEIKKILKEV